MDTARKRPLVTNEQVLLVAALLTGVVFLRCPGTEDVSTLWLPCLGNLERHGLVAGFRLNAANHPPLSEAILLGVRRIGAGLGASDFTSFKACLLLFYGLGIGVFRTVWQGFAPLVLFVGTILLSSILEGYVDVLYVPTLLLALWALRRRRLPLFSALYAVTCLIHWQPAIIAPFLIWYALRLPAADARPEEAPAGRWVAGLVAPGGLVILVVAFAFGRPLLRALGAAVADPYLSGTALNADWAWTFLLHCWAPTAFTPLIDDAASPVLIGSLQGWAVLAWLSRTLFVGVYATTLWRFVRGGGSFPELLRATLFGSLAYCLLDTGVHENGYFVAAVLACVLAAAEPGETARAIVVTGMAALNLVIFYGFTGSGLNYPRVLGIDLTFPLSLLYVAAFFWWWVGWLRTGAWVRRPPAALTAGTPLDLGPKSA